MKFNCGPSISDRIKARHEKLSGWHTWFAWHPVRIGPSECIWLEHVLRKGELMCDFSGCCWYFEYERLSEGKDSVNK